MENFNVDLKIGLLVNGLKQKNFNGEIIYNILNNKNI